MSASDSKIETLYVRKLFTEKNNQRRLQEDENLDANESSFSCNVTSYKKISKNKLLVEFDLNLNVIDSNIFKFETIINVEELFIFEKNFVDNISEEDVDTIIKKNADFVFKPALNKASALYNSFIIDSGLVRDKVIDIANSTDFDEPIVN